MCKESYRTCVFIDFFFYLRVFFDFSLSGCPRKDRVPPECEWSLCFLFSLPVSCLIYGHLFVFLFTVYRHPCLFSCLLCMDTCFLVYCV